MRFSAGPPWGKGHDDPMMYSTEAVELAITLAITVAAYLILGVIL